MNYSVKRVRVRLCRRASTALLTHQSSHITHRTRIPVWARQRKLQGAWLLVGLPGFDSGCRRGEDFSLLLRVQTGPGVRSASYKMSTEGFPWGKGGRVQDQPPYLFLVPWLCIRGPLNPHPPWAFMACNGDTFTFTRIPVHNCCDSCVSNNDSAPQNVYSHLFPCHCLQESLCNE